MSKKYFVLILSVFFLSGCSQKVKSVLADSESTLNTGSKLQKFHSIVYYPNDITLDFPGYIVGVEKSPKKAIFSSSSTLKFDTKKKSSGIKRTIFRIKKEPKVLYVSHILRYNGCGKKSDFIYNLYGKDKKNIPWAFDKSYEALKLLKQDIDKNIDKYDSVIVFVMGWNTSQEEAVRNFNALYKNLKESSNNTINPLFIGVTWPSEWEVSMLPDDLVKLFSFPVKANDADELGVTWLGMLIHKTLADIEKPLYIIGHSFGARATTMALFEGNILYKDKPYSKKYANTLISLQGAYSVKRFLPKGLEGIEYDISNVEQIVLTSSKYDYAMDTAFWKAYYVGDDKSYKKYCEDEQKFMCGVYDENYQIVFNRASKITYLNCDSIIKNNAYLSGGGAHSDIYDKEMGEFIWKVLKRDFH